MLHSKRNQPISMDVNNNNTDSSLTNYKALINSLSFTSNAEAKELSVYRSYFRRVFTVLSERTEGLPMMTLANYLPYNYFITENIYRAFHFLHHSHSYLKQDDFVKGIIALYKGSFNQRLSLLFDFLDLNSDGVVLLEDVRVLFSHLYSLSSNKYLNEGYSIIEAFFQGDMLITKDDFILKTKRQNSDIFFLFYYLINYNKPIDETSINYYQMHVYRKDLINAKDEYDDRSKKKAKQYDLSSNDDSDSDSDEDIISTAIPSDMLYDFLNNNFNCNFIIDSELNELDDFEENIETVINESLTKCNNNFQLPNKKLLSSCGLINNCKLDSVNSQSDITHLKKPLSSSDLKTPSSNQLPTLQYGTLYDFYTHSSDEEFSLNKLEIVGNDLYTYKVISASQLKFKQIFPLTQLHFEIEDTKRDTNGKVPVHLISTICNKLKDSLIYFDSITVVNQIQRLIESKSKQRKIEDEYEFISVLGKGSFGTVLEAEQKSSKKHYAVKLIIKNYDTEWEIEQMKMEKDISAFLKQFPYKGIVKIIDIFETYDTLYIVQEYIRDGNLNEFIKEKHNCKLPIALAYEIMQQLIDSISHLKSFGIVHRDLKTENILIRIRHSKGNHSQSIQTKIIDFGLSAIIGKEEKLTEKLGTLCYLPPEILSNKPYDFKIDIWTLGIICYCLLYGKHPFVQDNMEETINKINHKTIILPELRHDNEKEIMMRKVIEECLQRDIMFRPSINSIAKQFNNNTE